MIIKTALLAACLTVLAQVGVERVQRVSKLWAAPSATCEGLPHIMLIPVPVQVPPKGTGV